MNNSPDGDSPNFSVTNIATTGLFFMASASFPLQSSSTYTFTFYVANTATDSSWTSQVSAQVACGSYGLATADMTKATLGPNNYMASSTTFNTLTDTSPLTLQQLGNCQVQIAFHPSVQTPNQWFLAKVGVSYVGPMVPASPPPTSSVVP
ncbi:uncharacterized protein TrAFT101_007921 [Trichoderma asperellum]|nr:hypothetical protein TrAFT101_007921 [Trichoderma asperellum]